MASCHDPKIEKLLELHRSVVSTPASARPLDLREFGLTPADLTLEFLRAADGRPRIECVRPLLYLLAERGYLTQIHECITPPVALICPSGWMGGFPRNYPNLLMYCAESGRFDELPGKYQTRRYLLDKSHDRTLGRTPLEVSAQYGFLAKLPLHLLKPKDINKRLVMHACSRKQIDLLERLVKPRQFTAKILISFCIAANYLPPTVLKNISVNSMLRKTHLGSPLSCCVRYGVINQIPTGIFVNDFAAAKREITRGIDDTKAKGSIPVGCNGSHIADAEAWRIRLAQQVLSRNPPKPKIQMKPRPGETTGGAHVPLFRSDGGR